VVDEPAPSHVPQKRARRKPAVQPAPLATLEFDLEDWCPPPLATPPTHTKNRRSDEATIDFPAPFAKQSSFDRIMELCMDDGGAVTDFDAAPFGVVSPLSPHRTAPPVPRDDTSVVFQLGFLSTMAFTKPATAAAGAGAGSCHRPAPLDAPPYAHAAPVASPRAASLPLDLLHALSAPDL